MNSNKDYLRYFRYIPSFFKWIKTCKNWQQIILLHLHAIKGDIRLNLRNGLTLRLMNKGVDSDTITLSELYWDRPYTRDGFDIKNNDIVVDIGANVGIFSTFAVKSANNVRVFAYEASPETFKYLKTNIDHNKLFSSIKAHNLAVSGRNGNVRLFLHEKGSGGNSLFTDNVTSKNKNYVEIRAITLRDIFVSNRLDRIDFLKLDCEGAEYDILLGSRKELLDKIGKIAMEVHKIKGHTVQQLKNHLSKSGFKIREYKNGKIVHAYRD